MEIIGFTVLTTIPTIGKNTTKNVKKMNEKKYEKMGRILKMRKGIHFYLFT